MTEGRVSFAVNNNLACLRLEGELRHSLAEVIDDFSASLFNGDLGLFGQLVLDLGEASFMDSTVIGLLVTLARECRSRALPQPVLICSHPELLAMVHAMRLQQVFRLTGPAADAKEMLAGPVHHEAGKQADELRQTRLILKAHQALIAADESNRQAFEAVVELLQQEVKRLQQEQGMPR